MRTTPVLAILLAAGILAGSGPAGAQGAEDGLPSLLPPLAMPPSEASGAEPLLPGEAPPDAPSAPSEKTPDEPPPEKQPSPAAEPPLALPDAMMLQAQFTAGMATVDTGIAALAPAVGRTVGDLRRLALTRVPLDPAMVRDQRRLLDIRVRELAYEDNRLSSYERTLHRWRAGMVGSSIASASMISGVRQRANQLIYYRRQIECGRYFARAAHRAYADTGEPPRRAVIPPGC